LGGIRVWCLNDHIPSLRPLLMRSEEANRQSTRAHLSEEFLISHSLSRTSVSVDPLCCVFVYAHFILISLLTLLRHQFFMKSSLYTNFYVNAFDGALCLVSSWNLMPIESSRDQGARGE
jgi:hypothetical protein